jgi:thioredoxin 1
MQPFVEEVKEHFKDADVEFIQVDAEEADLLRNPNNQFQVLKVPTHIVIKNGKQIHHGYEFLPKEVLID